MSWFFDKRLPACWQVGLPLAILGLLSLVGFIVLMVKLAHHDPSGPHELEPEEIGKILVRPINRPQEYDVGYWGYGKSWGYEFHFNEDSLRKLAKEGDWFAFYVQPACASLVGCFVLFGLTGLFLCIGLSLYCYVASAVSGLFFIVVPWLGVRAALRPDDDSSP